MTATYRIAEELISLSAPEQWLMLMANMAPVRVMTDDTSVPAFALEVKEHPCLDEPSAFNHFFTDNSEADMPRLEVYQSDTQWLIRIAQTAQAPVCCRLVADKDFRHARLAVLSGQSATAVRFAIDNAVMLLFAFATAHRHTLEMHASVVVHERKAYLFLGHSGTGKSTHARQWLALYHWAYLLNDDNPVLRIDDDGQLWVYGTPWSGKTPCYRNERVRVAALVQLEQAPHNEVLPLAPSQCYAYMLSSCSGLKIVHEAMDGIHDTISRIVLHTPMAKLRCLPDKPSAQCCYDYFNSPANHYPTNPHHQPSMADITNDKSQMTNHK